MTENTEIEIQKSKYRNQNTENEIQKQKTESEIQQVKYRK